MAYHRFLITQDVVGEQFRALEREDVGHAYKFVHESIKEQYSLDVDRYEQIFKGAAQGSSELPREQRLAAARRAA